LQSSGTTLNRLMAGPQRWLVTMAVALVLGASWIWQSAVPASAVSGGLIPSPRQGFLAPDLVLPDLEGGTIDLSELRGQVVIVNFWASWCPPCRAEMPALERTQEAHAGDGLVVLAVNATNQDSLPAVISFIEEMGLTLPIALDQSGEVGRRYQVRALPTTFFIDRQGVIQEVIVGGPVSESTLLSTVQSLLGEGS